MIEDTYKGESLGKKLARLHLWIVAKEVMLAEEWKRGPHVVLASREAGDVSVMLGLGMPPQAIVGIDRSESAIAQARLKFPGVRFEHVDAAKFAARAKSRGEKVASAFLDFCAPLSRAVVSATAAVLDVVRDKGFVGIGVLRGREQGEYRKMLERPSWLPPDSHVRYESDLDGKLWDRDTMLIYAWARPPVQCVARGWMPFSLGEHHYMSTTSSGRGVPMMYMTAIQCRRMVGEARRSFLHRFLLESDVIGNVFCADGRPYDYIMRAPSFRPHETVEEIRKMAMAVAAGRYEWTVNDVRQHVGFAKPPTDEQVSLLLNVPRSTLSAWRAHTTRGTYARRQGETNRPSRPRSKERAMGASVIDEEWEPVLLDDVVVKRGLE